MRRFNIYQAEDRSFKALEVGGGVAPADTDAFCAEVTEDAFPYQVGTTGDQPILLQLP